MAQQPFSYYGGKQQLWNKIKELIPDHKTYTESFVGGGTVFWSKKPAKVEILNDQNSLIVNFYQQVQSNFDELNSKIQETPFSRDVHKLAQTIYEHPYLFDNLTRAWAVFICASQSFLNMLDSTWKHSGKYHQYVQGFGNKKINFKEHFSKRLNNVQIENKDALYVIQSKDNEEAFHYIDPPYPKSNQGHYGGYTMDDFIRLLEVLKNIKGKFMLSSYPYPELKKYAKENGWEQVRFEKNLSASSKKGKKKIEVLTMNYHSQ